MKKQKKITLIGTLILCLPLCGAWTTAQAETPEEVYYPSGSSISTYANDYSTETISYISKTVVDEYCTPNSVPRYTSYNMENGCGAVAGAIAIGYYDKYYTNLIPDWSPCYSNGAYRAMDSVHVPALQQDLYTRMKINVSATGVTESNFKSGLSGYISSKGYSSRYEEIGNKSTFDYNKYKSAISNNEIVVLFVYPSNLYSIGQYSDYDSVRSTYIPSNHIMIAYGYCEIKYTTSSGTRTDKYLQVGSGLLGQELCFYKVGSYIESADILHIS